MSVLLGSMGQPGFDEPIALMMDCHRRIERFLGVLQHVAAHCGSGRLDEESQRAVQKPSVRANRLALLLSLSHQFLQVADVSLLQA